MLLVKSKTPNQAWRQCLRELLQDCQDTDNTKFYRDECVLIEIKQPCIEPIPSTYPMTQAQITQINEYMRTGEHEEQVVHEWTKLYLHRIFDGPDPQIDYLLNKLGKNPPSGKTLISLWDAKIDQNADISPCVQTIWCRK